MASLMDSIKKQANKNGTKIQTSQDAELEKILNRLFYLDKNVEEETKFVKHVMTRGLETQERVGLHASAFIVSDKEFCIRKQVLSLIYKQEQGHEVPVGLKRIFEEGNCVHEKWQRLFIRGGYSKTEDLDFTRMNEEYHISFTPDIICRIPEFHDGLMISEVKSVNTFQFKKMDKHPSGFKQLQWYMYLTGIHKGFTLCDDKNCQDFKAMVYDYDPKEVATYIERADAINYYYDKVYLEGRMVKRHKEATSPNCKKCNDCVMKDACWNVGKGKIKLGS
jgi:hypothetical protein